FAPKDPRSSALRMHCQTSGWSLTSQAPWNNVSRTTLEALAAVLGGTQSLHTNSYDEAIALPTPASARIARNTQLVLQEESCLRQLVDPAGGSFHVERLTQDLAARASALLDEIEVAGGMAKAIERGLPKMRIEEAAARRQARIDSGADLIVGVNRWQPGGDEELDVLRIDNLEAREAQIARLAKLRAARDAAAVERSLAALEAGARGDANLLALAIDAARAGATVGEISGALEAVYGRYQAEQHTIQGVYA